MKFKRNKLSCLLTIALLLSLLVSTNAATDASINPPGGLEVSNVPQFICFGSDDNPSEDGVQWLVDFLEGKKNKDGSAAKMSFFVNGVYTTQAAKGWLNALAGGHELGNHTYDHFPNHGGDTASKSTWDTQLSTTMDELTGKKIGMPAAAVTGFRTPYLEYNPTATFDAVNSAGLKYDCSIEQGVSDASFDGTNFTWPYTLDNGSTDDGDVSKIAGLWELPVAEFIIPTDSACSAYGIGYSLRDSLAIRKPLVVKDGDTIQAGYNKSVNHITGLDYNVMLAANYGDTAKIEDWIVGAGVDSAEYAAILRYNYEIRKASNRSPFTIGIHSQFYIKSWDGQSPNIGWKQRQGVIEDFINLVLQDSDVRVCTYADLVRWMESPVGLDGTGANPGPYNVTVQAGNGTVSVSPEKTSYTAGDTITLTAVADSGYMFFCYNGDAFGTDATMKTVVNSDMIINGIFITPPIIRPGCDTSIHVDMLNTGSWSTDSDAKSEVQSPVSVVDSSIKITYTLAQQSNSPWIDMVCKMPTTTYKNLAALWKIKITYNSAQQFIMALPEPATGTQEAGWAHWQVVLPSTEGWVTKEFTWEQFGQPDWKLMHVPLDLTTVNSIAFAPSFETASGPVSDSIMIKELTVIGINPDGTDEPITPIATLSKSNILKPAIYSINGKEIKISLPSAGKYDISFFSLNGRKVANINVDAAKAGIFKIALDKNIARGMYVANIKSKTVNAVQKLNIFNFK